MSYIDHLKSNIPRLPCKICGSQPIYKKVQRTYGFGEYPIVGWIECTCGLRTKEYIIDGYYGSTDNPDTPVLVWNNIMQKIKGD